MSTILAVDDQKSNLLSIKGLIDKFLPDCTVLTSLSAKEGLTIAQKEQPDVILLDVVMPEMDGFEMCRKLKVGKQTKHIPLIMITAIQVDSESRTKGLNIGADAFLSKPIEASEFIAQLNVMFRIKKAEDQLRAEKKAYQELIKKRTAELSRKNKKLELENAERKHAEKLQKVLFNISKAAITSESLRQLIIRIQIELNEVIDTKNFFIALYNKETDTLSLPFMADEKDNIESVPAGKTMSAYVIRNQKPLLATASQQEDMVAKGLIEFVGSRSKIWLGVPLKSRDEVMGVIVVQSYTSEEAYSKTDMELLEFISDQVSILIDRKKSEQYLISALEKATESDRLKSSFMATMSHELRTPLNSIIGFSDFINKELSIDEILDLVNTINESGYHLLSIIEDIFDITLIETGDIRYEKEEVAVMEFLNDVHEATKAEQIKANKEHLDLKLVCPSDSKQLIFETDVSKVKKILINILKNAIKFTLEGFVEYGFDLLPVKDNKTLKFYVKDTGIGIPVDKADIIFEAFRQVEDSDSRTFGGTGIGLAVSKRLVEFLGGKIWFESEEDVGSTFYFTIPVKCEVAKPPSLPLEIDVIEDVAAADQSKCILIVEDDESNYLYLKLIVEKMGYKTAWAENGKEAVDYCKNNKDVCLVLMDLNMPIMNGYEATIKIKKLYPDLPVIAQLAYVMNGDESKVKKVGCDGYIPKPIKKELLLKKIQELCLYSLFFILESISLLVFHI